MGKMQRVKGRGYELEVCKQLQTFSPASRTSEAGISVPDLYWMDRYVECRRRADTYQSLAKVQAELDGDAALYVTRLDRGDSLVVLTLDTLLDLLTEARQQGAPYETGGMRYG